MPHVNPKGVDWVVSIFIVHPTEPRVLLVDHKKLGGWFSVGGHIGDSDPYETADKALYKEVGEECGLEVTVVDPPALLYYRPDFDPATNHNSVMLHTPWAVELHDFQPVPGHLHCALVYLARAHTAEPTLEAEAHKAIRWFSHDDLELPEFKSRMLDTIRWYAHEALRLLWGAPYAAEWTRTPVSAFIARHNLTFTPPA